MSYLYNHTSVTILSVYKHINVGGRSFGGVYVRIKRLIKCNHLCLKRSLRCACVAVRLSHVFESCAERLAEKCRIV